LIYIIKIDQSVERADLLGLERRPAMNMQLSKSPIGLDGVAAAETVLSHVDGERGELIIAGERVGDLVRKTSFEGVTARLWSGGTGQPTAEAWARRANAPLPGCRS
jgi:citrate synthase